VAFCIRSNKQLLE